MTEGAPAQPRDAATVILVREVDDRPWECFMVRRHVASEFAPDVYVFPGGKVDEGDRDARPLHGVDDRRREDVVTFPDDDMPFRMAAIRELFEEVGVLLAVGADDAVIRINPDRAHGIEAYRQQVHDGSLTLLSLEEVVGGRLAPGLLVPFSRWITPVIMPRRYDTRFYVAALPEGQEPMHDAVETTHGVWITPAEAVRRYGEGDFPLVFATLWHLERMNQFARLDNLLSGTTPDDLKPVIPQIVERDGERVFLLPGDEGYEAE